MSCRDRSCTKCGQELYPYGGVRTCFDQWRLLAEAWREGHVSGERLDDALSQYTRCAMAELETLQEQQA